VRQFHVAGGVRWKRCPPNHSAIATFGAKLPVLSHVAEWRTVGGRCVAGICHLPLDRCIPTGSQILSLAEFHVEGVPLVFDRYRRLLA
jgi:hypothetical protein